MKNENKSILTAVLLSLVVIFGMELLFPSQKTVSTSSNITVQKEPIEEKEIVSVPEIVLSSKDETAPVVTIQSETLSGSIRKRNAVFRGESAGTEISCSWFGDAAGGEDSCNSNSGREDVSLVHS